LLARNKWKFAQIQQDRGESSLIALIAVSTIWHNFLILRTIAVAAAQQIAILRQTGRLDENDGLNVRGDRCASELKVSLDNPLRQRNLPGLCWSN
jgi:hypothetical protein